MAISFRLGSSESGGRATPDGPGSVETMGLEPTTPCLQSRCSSQLSYVPEVNEEHSG